MMPGAEVIQFRYGEATRITVLDMDRVIWLLDPETCKTRRTPLLLNVGGDNIVLKIRDELLFAQSAP